MTASDNSPGVGKESSDGIDRRTFIRSVVAAPVVGAVGAAGLSAISPPAVALLSLYRETGLRALDVRTVWYNDLVDVGVEDLREAFRELERAGYAERYRFYDDPPDEDPAYILTDQGRRWV